jgi:hypothetical protein
MCTDTTLPAAPSSSLHFGIHPCCSSKNTHRPTVATLLYGTNFPVHVLPGQQQTTQAPTPRAASKSSSIDIIEQSHPAACISVGSQFGSIPHGLQKLNPTMLLLPCLVVEGSEVACAICHMVVTSATVVQANLLTFSATLRLMTSWPIATVSIPLRSADKTIQRFLTSSCGIAGINLHAPRSSSSTLSLHWLCAALQKIDLLLELTRAWCFLITIPLQEDMEISTFDQLSSTISSHFCDCHTWQFWCGNSSLSFFGNPVHARKWMAFGLRDEITDQQPVFPSTVQESSPLSQCLDASLNYQSNQYFTFGAHLRSRITVTSSIPNDVTQFFPWTLFDVSKPPTKSSSTPATMAVQNTDYLAPASIH